jgi:hypothetical protein
MKIFKKALDSGLQKLSVGAHEFSGYYASGSVTTCSYSVEVISGVALATPGNGDGNETWSAGAASGGSSVKRVEVAENSNFVLRTYQYNNGKSAENFYIAGNGGEAYQTFLTTSETEKHLLSNGVTLNNITVEECLALPVNWLGLLHNPCETFDMGHGYCGGGPEYIIRKDEEYITVEVTTTSNSCVKMRGYNHTKTIAQWLPDGTNNMRQYKAWQFREQVRRFLAEYPALTKAQAIKWFGAKVNWKHEVGPVLAFQQAQDWPVKSVWERIAAASSREGNKICKENFGFEWYGGKSVPRSSAHAELLAKLCD